MDHLTFFKHIKESIKKCYVFLGDEEFVKERAIDALKETVLKDANVDFNLQHLGEDADVTAVTEAVSTLPFMGEVRLVVWNNPKIFTREMSDDDLENLGGMLTSLHDAVCLLIAIKGNADKRRKYYKVLKGAAELVEFNALSEFEAARWVGSTMKKQGKQIDLDTAEEIVARVGTSVMELNQETAKLTAICGDRVTKDDLRVITGANISFDVFGMISCLLSGKKDEGMSRLYRLLERGDNGFMIMGALAAKLRGYYQAKILLEKGMKKPQVIETLGGGYGAKKAVEECSGLSIQAIKIGVDALAYAEYAVKNGLMSEGIAVEYAVGSAFFCE